jgi:hypothetical protein
LLGSPVTQCLTVFDNSDTIELSNQQRGKQMTNLIEQAVRYEVWYKDGNLHRVDGPAVEDADGTKRWFKGDKLHRVEVRRLNIQGTKYWYKDGERHREDGPAVEDADGTKLWYKNNQTSQGRRSGD